MRIAQVAPLCEAVPPRLYGGTERVVHYLTEALVTQGHQVTLFASGDSQSSAQLVPCRDKAIRLEGSPLHSELAAHLLMLDEVAARSAEFDIIHLHVDLLYAPSLHAVAYKTLTTTHGRMDLKGYPEFFQRFQAFPLVSISNAQRTPLPTANWFGTVYHGLPQALYRFSPQPATLPYLVFLGRISPEKRPDRAITMAKACGIPLKIAAKVDKADRDYFQDQIKPLLSHPLIEFLGEVGEADKAKLLAGALGLLLPIDWPEPFGLVMIEAMACGTPVVAFRCGSVPEIVTPNRTGFVVNTLEEGIAAVSQLGQLNRRAIRQTFEQRFSADVMAQQYASLYQQRLAEAQLPRSASVTAHPSLNRQRKKVVNPPVGSTPLPVGKVAPLPQRPLTVPHNKPPAGSSGSGGGAGTSLSPSASP